MNRCSKCACEPQTACIASYFGTERRYCRTRATAIAQLHTSSQKRLSLCTNNKQLKRRSTSVIAASVCVWEAVFERVWEAVVECVWEDRKSTNCPEAIALRDGALVVQA